MVGRLPSVDDMIVLLRLDCTAEEFRRVFRVEGPALISFSGGRTSGLMLLCILVAYDGVLPDGIYVVFANTGLEREETLRFVHECETRWGIRIYWLEWKNRVGRKTPAAERFDVVGFNSAARDGEPFKALIRRKKYLPNAVTRFCTAELKIDTMKQFMISLGFKSWRNVVGLRSDEMRRIAKQQKRNDEGRERWRSTWPLLHAKITKGIVWTAWLGNNLDPRALVYPLPLGFDLGLWPYEGNCTHCFLKGRDVLTYQEREMPGSLDIWIDIEDIAADLTSNPTGARFVTEYSYRELKAEVERSPLLFPIDPSTIEAMEECGVGGTDTKIRCGARG